MGVYEQLPNAKRPLYAALVAKLATGQIQQPEWLIQVEQAIAACAAWCDGEIVSPHLVADLIHDDRDTGIDLLAQLAHQHESPAAAALDAIVYAVAYVGWHINLNAPPVLELFDNASEAMLGEMESFACSCRNIDRQALEAIAKDLLSS